jgi:hypothetical protein
LPQSRFQLLVLVRIAQGGACLKRGLGRVEHPLQHLEVERVIESFGGVKEPIAPSLNCRRESWALSHRGLLPLSAGDGGTVRRRATESELFLMRGVLELRSVASGRGRSFLSFLPARSKRRSIPLLHLQIIRM